MSWTPGFEIPQPNPGDDVDQEGGGGGGGGGVPAAHAASHEDGGSDEVSFASVYAAKAYGTFVKRVRIALTDKTSFSGSTGEQWGTEEATIDDAELPLPTGDVDAYATVTGYIQNYSTDQNVNAVVEISLDGGSTWSSSPTQAIKLGITGSTTTRLTVSQQHQTAGAVTGDILARATLAATSGAVQDGIGGVLVLEVIQQQL